MLPVFFQIAVSKKSSHKITTPRPPPCDPTWTQLGPSCYRHFCDHQTRNQDQSFWECQKLNATLASVHSSTENDFIRDLATGCRHSYVWLGAKVVRLQPIRLVWLDGSTDDFNRFKGDNIYQHDLLYSGVQLKVSDGQWLNFRASDDDSVSYVCQKNIK